jgi:hypothetical protein
MCILKKLILNCFGSGCLALAGCATYTHPSAQNPKTGQPVPIVNFHIAHQTHNAVPLIYRSGQPVAEREWAYLHAIGIRSIIKLNQYSDEISADEELRLANRYGIKNLISVYMQPEDFTHNINLWAAPDLATLMRAVTALENPENLPALVHCSHGKDRTGLVIAAFNIRNNNYSPQQAIEQMKYYGTSPFLFGLKPMVNKIPLKSQL